MPFWRRRHSGSGCRRRCVRWGGGARQLVPERGWTAVSTRGLADRAGVTPSVVHYHFPSLTALLNEAAVGTMRQLLAGLSDLLATARTPVDAVDALLGAVDQYTGSDPLSRLAIEAYLAATRDEQLRVEIAAVLEEFRQEVGRWLAERGVREPETTAAVLAAAIDGVLLHRGLVDGPDTAAIAAVLHRLVG